VWATPKPKLESASVEQIDNSLRAWRGIVVYSGFMYAAVAAIAFWVGWPIVGALMIVVGLVGVPLHQGRQVAGGQADT
jgi:hypothetical protein